jgi:hypothetical protein
MKATTIRAGATTSASWGTADDSERRSALSPTTATSTGRNVPSNSADSRPSPVTAVADVGLVQQRAGCAQRPQQSPASAAGVHGCGSVVGHRNLRALVPRASVAALPHAGPTPAW